MPSPTRSVRAALWLAIAAAALGGCAHYEIVGYQAAWKPATRFAPGDLTVVNYAFVDICWKGEHGHPVEGGLRPCLDPEGSPATPPDGSIVLDDPVNEKIALVRLDAMRKQNASLKLMASVGGWTRSNRFSDMADDTATRNAFVRSSVEFLRRHQLRSARLGLSARAHHRVLKVARTIADLQQSSDVRSQDVAEALRYRGISTTEDRSVFLP